MYYKIFTLLQLHLFDQDLFATKACIMQSLFSFGIEFLKDGAEEE